MKNRKNKTTRSTHLCVAAIALSLLSACAVSEDTAGTAGALVGGGTGAILGNQLGGGKLTGSRTGDTIIGGILGAGIGQAVGKSTTSLKGTKKTELPDQ